MHPQITKASKELCLMFKPTTLLYLFSSGVENFSMIINLSKRHDFYDPPKCLDTIPVSQQNEEHLKNHISILKNLISFCQCLGG